jgi:hypothetical protein
MIYLRKWFKGQRGSSPADLMIAGLFGGIIMKTKIRNILITLVLLFGIMPFMPAHLAKAATWGDTNGYSYRKILSFNALSISSSLTNFPVKVHLDSSNFDFSLVQADLDDIRFVAMDDATVLNTENASWDGESDAVFWVSVNITANTNTDYISMYYGNPGASSNWNTTAVWANAGANWSYHFGTTNNSGSTIYNSSNPALTVTDNNTSWSLNGRELNGVDSSLEYTATFPVAITANYTITGSILAHNTITAASVWSHYTNVTNRKHIKVYNGNLTFETYNGTFINLSGSITPNVPTYFTATSENNVLKFYIDGNPVVRTIAGATISPYKGFGRNDTIQYFDGIISEFQVYNYIQSPAEAMAGYLNANDILINYGDTELLSSVTTLPASSISMDKDGLTTGSISGNITSLGGAANTDISIDYGLTTSYGDTFSFPFDYKITVDTTALADYGFTYPLTYEFAISPTASNMSASRRYTNTESWTSLPIKTTADFFNGIETVRFDYTLDRAYVSVLFGSATNTIYLRFYEDGIPDGINTQYIKIPEFYDNRKMAVTVTLDDWSTAYFSEFTTALENLRSRQIWSTCGVYSGAPVLTAANWSTIQAELNLGYVEVAGHSRTHPHTPYGDAVSEIEGNKQDITGNLTLPILFTRGTTEYLPTWLEPYGDSDAAARAQLGISKYLIDRRSADGGIWSVWDSTNGLYSRNTRSISMGSDGSDNITELNAKFDSSYSKDKVYQIMAHPYNVDWSVGAYAQTHLDYIAGKLDVWYVALGNLYQYHYANEPDIITVKSSTDLGNVTNVIPTNLIPGQTYHYRISSNTIFGTTNGNDVTFTLTMPSITTVSATNTHIGGGSEGTFKGNISDMGVASTCTAFWQWGIERTALSNTVGTQTVSATGDYSYDFYDSNSYPNIYFRFCVQNSSVIEYGDTLSFNADKISTLYQVILGYFPIIIILGLIVLFITLMVKKSATLQTKIIMTIGFVVIIIVLSILQMILIKLLPRFW